MDITVNNFKTVSKYEVNDFFQGRCTVKVDGKKLHNWTSDRFNFFKSGDEVYFALGHFLGMPKSAKTIVWLNWLQNNDNLKMNEKYSLLFRYNQSVWRLLDKAVEVGLIKNYEVRIPYLKHTERGGDFSKDRC